MADEYCIETYDIAGARHSNEEVDVDSGLTAHDPTDPKIDFGQYLDAASNSQLGHCKYAFFRDYCEKHLKPDNKERVYDDWVATFGFVSDVYVQHKNVAVLEALASNNCPLVIYYMKGEEDWVSKEQVRAIWDTLVHSLEESGDIGDDPAPRDDRFLIIDDMRFQKVTFLAEFEAEILAVLKEEDLQGDFLPVSRAPADMQQMAELTARPFIGYRDAVWVILNLWIRRGWTEGMMIVLMDAYEGGDFSDAALRAIAEEIYNWFVSDEFVAGHPNFNFLQQAHFTDWGFVHGLYGNLNLWFCLNDCFMKTLVAGKLVKQSYL